MNPIHTTKQSSCKWRAIVKHPYMKNNDNIVSNILACTRYIKAYIQMREQALESYEQIQTKGRESWIK